jgi:hypothetical protein
MGYRTHHAREKGALYFVNAPLYLKRSGRPSHPWLEKPSCSIGRHILLPERLEQSSGAINPELRQGRVKEQERASCHQTTPVGEIMMIEPQKWIGIDVSQKTLDIHIRPEQEASSVTHDAQGIEKVVEKCRSLNPERIIIEATGGLEIELAVALFQAQLPVVVINPRQARDFARATGEMAKSDRSRNCGFIREITIRLALVAIAVHLPSPTFIVRWA